MNRLYKPSFHFRWYLFWMNEHEKSKKKNDLVWVVHFIACFFLYLTRGPFSSDLNLYVEIVGLVSENLGVSPEDKCFVSFNSEWNRSLSNSATSDKRFPKILALNWKFKILFYYSTRSCLKQNTALSFAKVCIPDPQWFLRKWWQHQRRFSGMSSFESHFELLSTVEFANSKQSHDHLKSIPKFDLWMVLHSVTFKWFTYQVIAFQVCKLWFWLLC